MARFYFPTETAVNHAYRELVAISASDDDLIPSSQQEAQSWSAKIDAYQGLTKSQRLEGWNNFMGNIAVRFGAVYETLQMYDAADGAYDGVIDYDGEITEFSFYTEKENRPANLNTDIGIVGIGTASFYADLLEGGATTSGIPFSQDKFTVAHPDLPIGTMIEISHGDKKIVAMVTDRGPFAEDKGIPRCLDLSKKAFEALGGNLEEGTIRVGYHVVSGLNT